MQIDTQKTVEKTLAKYHWNNLKNWSKDRFGNFHRIVYQQGDLTISQKKWKDGHSIDIETPQLSLFISTGEHLDPFGSAKQVKYYSLNVSTTMGERNLYRSIIDEKGFKSIEGDRQLFLDMLARVPESYVALEKDEKGKYISFCWMNRPRFITNRIKKVRLGKEL